MWPPLPQRDRRRRLRLDQGEQTYLTGGDSQEEDSQEDSQEETYLTCGDSQEDSLEEPGENWDTTGTGLGEIGLQMLQMLQMLQILQMLQMFTEVKISYKDLQRKDVEL